MMFTLMVMFESVYKFFSYWYFRYLMVTELYMVERWERHTINAIVAVMFTLVWYFNVNYLVQVTSHAIHYLHPNS